MVFTYVHMVSHTLTHNMSWASYQIRKIAGCACAGNAGNVSPRHRFQRKPLVSDPGMHHGTCVTHVPWCMSGSSTCGDGRTFPAFPTHAHPPFCVSGKRPMPQFLFGTNPFSKPMNIPHRSFPKEHTSIQNLSVFISEIAPIVIVYDFVANWTRAR